MTIEEAKQLLRDNWEQGIECPCCNQLVKLYRRKLTSGMATALIQLYKESKGNTSQYIHIRRLGFLNGGEFAQLKRWGLINDKLQDTDEKRRSGLWRITSTGVDFVLGKISVPSHISTYNGKTVATTFPELPITIKEALGRKFNYAELMGHATNEELHQAHVSNAQLNSRAISWLDKEDL